MTTALETHPAASAARPDAGPGHQPADYGDFPGEVRAIHEALGVLEQSASGVLLVRGPDAAEFLSGLTTNDVKRLNEGRAQPNLLCANKGKVLHPVTVVRVKGDQYLVLTEPGEREAVAGHLDAYHIREDVEIGAAPLLRLDLLGPGAEPALQRLGLSGAAPLGTFQGALLLTLPLPLGALPRVLALLPAAQAPAFVEGLLALPGARRVGWAAFDEARIAAGVPRWGVDYTAEHLPAEAALYDHLSFNKGCYVGQEVHARLHHRGHVNRKLCAVLLPEAAAQPLQPGAPLFAGGEPAGQLTSLTRLSSDGQRRGIALVRWERITAGESLAASPQAPAEVRLATLATDLGAGRA